MTLLWEIEPAGLTVAPSGKVESIMLAAIELASIPGHGPSRVFADGRWVLRLDAADSQGQLNSAANAVAMPANGALAMMVRYPATLLSAQYGSWSGLQWLTSDYSGWWEMGLDYATAPHQRSRLRAAGGAFSQIDAAVSDNAWHVHTVTWTPAGSVLYLDGVQVGASASPVGDFTGKVGQLVFFTFGSDLASPPDVAYVALHDGAPDVAALSAAVVAAHQGVPPTVWEFDPATVTGVSNGSPISGTYAGWTFTGNPTFVASGPGGRPAVRCTMDALVGLANSTSPGTVAIAITTGVLTVAATHGLVVGDAVQLQGVTDAAPLVSGTTYYVASIPTGTTLTVAATLGGAYIPTTTAGTASGITKMAALAIPEYRTLHVVAAVTTPGAALSSVMMGAHQLYLRGGAFGISASNLLSASADAAGRDPLGLHVYSVTNGGNGFILYMDGIRVASVAADVGSTESVSIRGGGSPSDISFVRAIMTDGEGTAAQVAAFAGVYVGVSRTISWGAPLATGGSPVTGYRVRTLVGGVLAGQTLGPAVVSLQKVMAPGDAVQVIAVNALGESAPVEVVVP